MNAAVMPRSIEEVQQSHTDAWMTIPGVVGTAIGRSQSEPSILVLVADNPDRVRKQIPFAVEGYPVVIQQTGEFHSTSDGSHP